MRTVCTAGLLWSASVVKMIAGQALGELRLAVRQIGDRIMLNLEAGSLEFGSPLMFGAYGAGGETSASPLSIWRLMKAMEAARELNEEIAERVAHAMSCQCPACRVYLDMICNGDHMAWILQAAPSDLQGVTEQAISQGVKFDADELQAQINAELLELSEFLQQAGCVSAEQDAARDTALAAYLEQLESVWQQFLGEETELPIGELFIEAARKVVRDALLIGMTDEKEIVSAALVIALSDSANRRTQSAESFEDSMPPFLRGILGHITRGLGIPMDEETQERQFTVLMRRALGIIDERYGNSDASELMNAGHRLVVMVEEGDFCRANLDWLIPGPVVAEAAEAEAPAAEDGASFDLGDPEAIAEPGPIAEGGATFGVPVPEPVVAEAAEVPATS